MAGYFPIYWDERAGRMWLEIDKFDTEFLYIDSMPAGMGSNDLGLDRGQLGGSRIVKFIRSGPKILMIEPNYRYRADNGNPEERRVVEESFAQSVIWGFDVQAEEGGRVLVDATQFFLRDAHNIPQAIQRAQPIGGAVFRRRRRSLSASMLRAAPSISPTPRTSPRTRKSKLF